MSPVLWLDATDKVKIINLLTLPVHLLSLDEITSCVLDEIPWCEMKQLSRTLPVVLHVLYTKEDVANIWDLINIKN